MLTHTFMIVDYEWPFMSKQEWMFFCHDTFNYYHHISNAYMDTNKNRNISKKDRNTYNIGMFSICIRTLSMNIEILPETLIDHSNVMKNKYDFNSINVLSVNNSQFCDYFIAQIQLT